MVEYKKNEKYAGYSVGYKNKASGLKSDFSDKFPFSLPFIITSLSTCHIPCHNKFNIIILSFFIVDA